MNEHLAAIRARLPEVATIIEPGACDGEQTEQLSRNLKGGDYYILEPDARNFKTLGKRKFNAAVSFTIVEGAISDHTGYTDFHAEAPGRSASGSVLKPSDKLFRNYPELKFGKIVKVPCYTLDDFVETFVTSAGTIDLIWADIQGAEGMLIAGGSKTLKRTRLLNLEISECNGVYEGSWKQEEILKALATWEIVGQFGPDILLENIL